MWDFSKISRLGFCVLFLVAMLLHPAAGEVKADVFRIGLIGLDTSHVIAFTRTINDAKNKYGCRVVAGFKGGSPDVESSWSRVDKYTEQLAKEFGVEIVETIEELCTKVDGVMLTSVDGRPHLKQIKPVIAAKKPVYVDKPMAGCLEDVIEIFRLANEAKVPCWSSSSLRFAPGIIDVRKNNEFGEILGCEAYSPCKTEEHHPDLYWYGVHGVEILFTIMGTGCESVTRVSTDSEELVAGVWKGGRIGTFRGIKKGARGYGSYIYGTKKNGPSGNFKGYKPLVDEIVVFFKTGKIPVRQEETIEMFAFMSAADESKAKAGAVVSIESVIKKAKARKKR